MKLIIATNNKNKVEEMRDELEGLNFELLSLKDFSEIGEIIEDGSTFIENAYIKAKAVFDKTGEMTLADDSGLCVDALDGMPGVISARYAGEQGNCRLNNIKLLKEMGGIPDGKRGAHFTCAMVLIDRAGKKYDIEGVCNGQILHSERGKGGFGYDPLFFIPSTNKTMAELTMQEKNAISHRGIALRKVKKILRTIFGA